ncbi:MAG: hypothetical protein NWF00_08845 [Candidatus Bathyarchaeota archaeon]|nr:hypothetical protein [Candidatus Bathyarchaeota archaeon]
MSLPFDWLIFDLAKSATINASEKVLEKVRGRLYGSLSILPQTADEFASFDRTVREEILEELSRVQRELSFTSNSALKLSDSHFRGELEETRVIVERLCRSINSSEVIEPKKDVAINGLACLDLIILSDCFIMLETVRAELLDLGGGAQANVLALKTIKKAAQNVENVQHVKSLAITVGERQFLQILQARAPEVYEQVKGIASFAFYNAKTKKGLFKKAFLQEVSERAINVVKALEVQQKPLVSLKDFCLEFQKLNPDVNINHEDIEKALGTLAEHGLIHSVQVFNDGSKTAILKLDCKSVLDLVQADVSVQNNGLTVEQLMQKTGWSKDYGNLVLTSLETEDITRKVLTPDNTARYYFPGLSTSPA